MHGTENLNSLNRVDSKMFWQSVTNHRDQGRGAFLGILAVDEDKVGIFLGLDDVGNFATVNGMGSTNDPAISGLTEDLLEMNHRNHSAADNVPENQSRSDAGELIGISYQNQSSFAGQGIQEPAHEWDVDHGDLVDDNNITFQGIGCIALEATACRLKLEQTVKRRGLQASGFRHSLGRTPRRRSKDALQFLGCENL